MKSTINYDAAFTSLRAELGAARFTKILDAFGFASPDQIRAPKMKALVVKVMFSELTQPAEGGNHAA